MKIFLVTSKLNFEENGSPVGGSVVDLHLKAKGLAELGHDVSVVTAFSNADHIHGTLPYKVFQRRIHKRGLLALQFGVYRLLKEFGRSADVFYIDGHMFLYGAGAYRLFGGKVPVVGFFNIRLNSWSDTSGNIASPSLYRRAKKTVRFFLEKFLGAPLAMYLDAFVFNTPQVQKLYADFGIGKGRPSAVIQDFVATAELGRRFDIRPGSVQALQKKTMSVTILSTGRMIPEKGFELLLRAFALLPDIENYRLILSGGGSDKERLEALSHELGIRSRVAFPGWVPREELYRLFAQAHLFVFPRWWIEYGSAVLTEAMAFGLPSVIPGGGALEWLTDGCALTFTSDSEEELARRFSELQKDSELRMRLGIRSLARAQELDYLKLAKRLEQVLVSASSS